MALQTEIGPIKLPHTHANKIIPTIAQHRKLHKVFMVFMKRCITGPGVWQTSRKQNTYDTTNTDKCRPLPTAFPWDCQGPKSSEVISRPGECSFESPPPHGIHAAYCRGAGKQRGNTGARGHMKAPKGHGGTMGIAEAS